MFNIYIYYNDFNTAKTLKKICSTFLINVNSDNEIFCTNSIKKFENSITSNISLYFLEYVDSIESISKLIHNKNILNYIVLVAENSTELMSSIKPTIRLSGAILKPIKKEVLNSILNEISLDLKQFASSTTKEFFQFKSKTTEYLIPMNDILFFESRCKKIYLNTISQEFSYYSTLSNILDSLPDNFIRVHKGFIVNINNIKSIDYNQNIITLMNGYIVPISRTYKPTLREKVKERELI